VTVSFTDGAKALAIAAGKEHTCAVMDTSTRSVRCWGRNYYGQLGNATDTDSDGPVEVKSLTQAAGIAGGEEHSCAYLSSGAAYCWGDNWFGSLGDGNGGHTLYSTVPARVSGI
jgi:alpha-tubulin suppressor-like RCC1 family protein